VVPGEDRSADKPEHCAGLQCVEGAEFGEGDLNGSYGYLFLVVRFGSKGDCLVSGVMVKIVVVCVVGDKFGFEFRGQGKGIGPDGVLSEHGWWAYAERNLIAVVKDEEIPPFESPCQGT
jgi:hypothetical protein